MDLVQVEITAQLFTQRYGALSSGDILRTDIAFAKHLVDDCKGAKFIDVPESDHEVKKAKGK